MEAPILDQGSSKNGSAKANRRRNKRARQKQKKLNDDAHFAGEDTASTAKKASFENTKSNAKHISDTKAPSKRKSLAQTAAKSKASTVSRKSISASSLPTTGNSKKRKLPISANETQDLPRNSPTHQQKKPKTLADKMRQRLTAMQEKMKHKLEGGKFRILNEELYTTSGREAFQKFQRDPELFEVYHRGFREQAAKWPTNPLDVFISYLRQRPKLVVADFGCGDARLAQSVKNKVHSFDLVAANKYITACDMAHVPLKAGSVDLAVFCLSLMGTNLPDYLTEAHRILKAGGILKVAEVKSRFDDDRVGGIEGFISNVKMLGFDMVSKDETNFLFAFFEFKRADRKPTKSVEVYLKPCRYKKR